MRTGCCRFADRMTEYRLIMNRMTGCRQIAERRIGERIRLTERFDKTGTGTGAGAEETGRGRPDDRANDGEERVLVGSIQKFSTEDGPGIRTTVFFKGCPLRCRWCHNPEMIDPEQQLIFSRKLCIGCGHCLKVCPRGAVYAGPSGEIAIDRGKCDVCLLCTEGCYAGALRPVARRMSVSEIMEEVLADREFYDSTGGGVTLSGGEVLQRGEFIGELIDEAAANGIGVCLDTCGHWDDELLLSLAKRPNVTDILYDIKAADDEVHRAYTGVGNRKILGNLDTLVSDPETREKITIRMPLVSNVNDTDELIRKAGKIITERGIRRLDLLPYHDLGIAKMRNIGGEQERFEAPSEERISRIFGYFQDELGLDVHVPGRVQPRREQHR